MPAGARRDVGDLHGGRVSLAATATPAPESAAASGRLEELAEAFFAREPGSAAKQPSACHRASENGRHRHHTEKRIRRVGAVAGWHETAPARRPPSPAPKRSLRPSSSGASRSTRTTSGNKAGEAAEAPHAQGKHLPRLGQREQIGHARRSPTMNPRAMQDALAVVEAVLAEVVDHDVVGEHRARGTGTASRATT